MDSLELDLKNIQDQIDSLSEKLTNAQNQKLTTEVHLENEQKELDGLMEQLRTMTGLNDIQEIEQYLNNKQAELDIIMRDLNNVTGCINNQYVFTENDVKTLKNIIDKYNIPIAQ